MTQSTPGGRTGRGVGEPLPAVPERNVAHAWMRAAKPGARFRTMGGERVMVCRQGTKNIHDGPDFLDAVVLIDGEARRGAVEIHKRVEDWFLHGHHNDPAYRDVVLHVVLHPPDSPVFLLPPTVVLSSHLSAAERRRSTLATFHEQDAEFRATASGPTFADDDVRILLAASRRFARKTGRMAVRFSELAAGLPDEEAERQLVYECFARALGYGGNELPFQRLAEKCPRAELQAAGASIPGHSLKYITERAADVRGWRSAGVRPSNRAPARLAALAGMASFLLSRGWYEVLRAWIVRFPAAAGAARNLPAEMACRNASAGEGRMFEACVNVFAPWASFHAARYGDAALGRAAHSMYFRSPGAPSNRHVRAWYLRRDAPDPLLSGVQQGIIELMTIPR